MQISQHDSHHRAVKTATQDDLEQVAALFDQYRQFYGRAADLKLAKRFIGERLTNADSVILIADEPAAGFTQLYPSFSSASAARIYVLNDLFVAPTWRRTGVGRALLKAAETFARDAGAVALSLSTAIDNRPAQSLYESMGWLRDRRFYHYDLAIDIKP